MSRRRNKKYSVELKLQAVQDYLNGEGSIVYICKKHGILSDKQFQNWIKWYNGYKEIAPSHAEIYFPQHNYVSICFFIDS